MMMMMIDRQMIDRQIVIMRNWLTITEVDVQDYCLQAGDSVKSMM